VKIDTIAWKIEEEMRATGASTGYAALLAVTLYHEAGWQPPAWALEAIAELFGRWREARGALDFAQAFGIKDGKKATAYQARKRREDVRRLMLMAEKLHADSTLTQEDAAQQVIDEQRIEGLDAESLVRYFREKKVGQQWIDALEEYDRECEGE
jgi:hypothetical protein